MWPEEPQNIVSEKKFICQGKEMMEGHVGERLCEARVVCSKWQDEEAADRTLGHEEENTTRREIP